MVLSEIKLYKASFRAGEMHYDLNFYEPENDVVLMVFSKILKVQFKNCTVCM